MSCSVCVYWNPMTGCNHKEPADPYKTLTPLIVSFTHAGHDFIIETSDFKDGVVYAIKFFKEHARNENLIAFLRGETDNLEL